jgi:hypothetical protein
VQCLLPLLQPPNGPNSKIRVSKSLVENSTITLGRLAGACPAQVATALPSFLAPWCEALRGIRDDKEKTDAFWGMCKVREKYQLRPPPPPVQLAALFCWGMWHARAEPSAADCVVDVDTGAA